MSYKSNWQGLTHRQACGASQALTLLRFERLKVRNIYDDIPLKGEGEKHQAPNVSCETQTHVQNQNPTQSQTLDWIGLLRRSTARFT